LSGRDRLQVVAAAFGAAKSLIIPFENQPGKGMIARFTLVFVNRHFSFPYLMLSERSIRILDMNACPPGFGQAGHFL
jgi:hypothetical protein